MSRLEALNAEFVPAVLRGMAMTMLPGGWERLAAEMQREELSCYAEAIGVPRRRADEAAALYMIAIQRGIVSANDVRQRLLLEAMGDAGTTFEDAAGLLAHHVATDQMAYDSRPDDCWRCDARSADGALGLCTSCRRDLTER